jgi:agmatine/peptidylarginine deiminase
MSAKEELKHLRIKSKDVDDWRLRAQAAEEELIAIAKTLRRATDALVDRKRAEPDNARLVEVARWLVHASGCLDRGCASCRWYRDEGTRIMVRNGK